MKLATHQIARSTRYRSADSWEQISLHPPRSDEVGWRNLCHRTSRRCIWIWNGSLQ